MKFREFVWSNNVMINSIAEAASKKLGLGVDSAAGILQGLQNCIVEFRLNAQGV